jgi:TetR/AcrR family transcriptional regulator
MMNARITPPKDTFAKLPPDKRLKIEAALVREFAANGYQKASLNTVVNALGIAKGSLYQYFANKEAIFLYLFGQFTRMVKDTLQQPDESDSGLDLWSAVRRTILAGIAFIDRYPDYYHLYLNVLFERDVPHREELIATVREFSREYFSPLIARGQGQGEVAPVPVTMVVFFIDAVLDRFLQGYARSYLDGGLGLAAMDGPGLHAQVDLLVETLKHGLAGDCRGCPPP